MCWTNCGAEGVKADVLVEVPNGLVAVTILIQAFEKTTVTVVDVGPE
jgi:hypothetical protein